MNAPNPQKQPAPATTPAPAQSAQTASGATDFERLLLQGNEKTKVEFQAFGGDALVKLSIHVVQTLIARRTKKGETCSKEDAIRFMAMCQARHLNPFEGDAYLTGFDSRDDGPVFSLVTAQQTYLKRAELNPKYKGMESGIVVLTEDGPMDRESDFHMPEEQVVGGWARVHVEGQTIPTYRRLRMARFNKGRSVWNDDAAGMICKCAEADALRSAFPNSLGGLYMPHEMQFELNPDDVKTTALPPTKRGATRISVVPRVEGSAGPDNGTKAPPEDDVQHGDGAEMAAKVATEKAVEQAPNLTPQQQLSQVIEKAGFTFDQFRLQAEKEGLVADADSLAAYEDLKAADAQRLFKIRKLIIDGLTRANEVAS